MTFLDKTFCASPNCTNKCGRKMTEEEKEKLKKWKYWVSYSDFCSKSHTEHEQEIGEQI